MSERLTILQIVTALVVVLIVTFVAIVACLYLNWVTGCDPTQLGPQSRYELLASDDAGEPEEGLRFLGVWNGTQRLFTFSELGRCLRLRRWQQREDGTWAADPGIDGNVIRLEFGQALKVVSEKDCHAGHASSGLALPETWQFSGKGRVLAWLEPGDDSSAPMVKAATLEPKDWPGPGNAILIRAATLPSTNGIDAIVPFDDGRVLMIARKTGDLFRWDGAPNGAVTQFNRGVLGESDRVDGRADIVAAAAFKIGRISMGKIGVGFAPCKVWSLASIEQSKPKKVGTAFALGPNGRSILASSLGSLGVVELDSAGAGLRNLVKEQLTPLRGRPIDQVAWVDEKTVAIAGSGGIYGLTLKAGASGEYSLTDDLLIDGNSSIVSVDWLETTDHLLAYGASKSPPVVVTLKNQCAASSWGTVKSKIGTVTSFYAPIATTLGLLLAVWGLWRSRR